ncbi:hypothetical protein F5B18DRAFT_165476 [Nemania serpens]|nr:hypothetical protein F5B18DRAFT_165476 [Nemania serpens]
MEYHAPTPSFQATATPAAPPETLHYEQQQQQQHYEQQQQQQQQQQFEQPIAGSPFVGTDIRTLKTASEISLREYAALQRQGVGVGPGDERLRVQGSLAVSDLRALRSDVASVLRRAEAGRWRNWLLGGVVAAIIPAVRRIFRRSSDDRVSTNDTEHAFRKSKSLIARILDSAHGHGFASGFASVAFFVLAVLYVFQSEVSLRVARTVSRRLKRLVAKVENGVENVDEQDLRVLNGWRWRVLLW